MEAFSQLNGVSDPPAIGLNRKPNAFLTDAASPTATSTVYNRFHYTFSPLNFLRLDGERGV